MAYTALHFWQHPEEWSTSWDSKTFCCQIVRSNSIKLELSNHPACLPPSPQSPCPYSLLHHLAVQASARQWKADPALTPETCLICNSTHQWRANDVAYYFFPSLPSLSFQNFTFAFSFIISLHCFFLSMTFSPKSQKTLINVWLLP